MQTLSFAAIKNEARLASLCTDPLPQTTLSSLLASIPAAVPDSLTTYGLLDPATTDLARFLTPVFQCFFIAATAAPPPLLPTQRASACEICHRDWIPLTFHHLIPRSTHLKVIKRGWHEEWQLNSVAWLCRACHSFVHGIADNEELARDWFSVERLLERENVRRWATWVGKVRWKKL